MITPIVVAAASTVLQFDVDVDRVPDVDPVFGVAGGAVGTFVTTLVVGAILVAVVPEYTGRKTDELVENPVGSFVYGFASLVFLVLATLLLFVTLVGIVVAIPLVVLTSLAWAVGAAVAYLAIGERLVGREDGWLEPLAVGAAVSGGLTLTGVGGLVSFAIGAAGFGVVVRDYLG